MHFVKTNNLFLEKLYIASKTLFWNNDFGSNEFFCYTRLKNVTRKFVSNIFSIFKATLICALWQVFYFLGILNFISKVNPSILLEANKSFWSLESWQLFYCGHLFSGAPRIWETKKTLLWNTFCLPEVGDFFLEF